MTDTFLQLTREEMVWELEDPHWDRLSETQEGPRVIRQRIAIAVGRPVSARAPTYGSSGALSSPAASAVLVVADEICDTCLGGTGFWEQVLSTDPQAVDFGWAIGTRHDESERSFTGEMGEVLEELAKRSYHWFIASSEITAANPIPENAAGNVDLMAETWVKLGREGEGIDAILSNSLNELKEASAQAEEEGWPPPTPECLERTERLLKRMFEVMPHSYWIYPTSNGELVIDGGYEDHRIIVILPHEGGAIYTYRAPNTGELRAVESADSDNLPDSEMRIVLTRIGGGHDSA